MSLATNKDPLLATLPLLDLLRIQSLCERLAQSILKDLVQIIDALR
jgi:hypothetical protein